jgi:hypothetical protein
MNQPIREEFEKLKEELRQEFREEQRQLKEEMRQLREQRTEEIKAVRVEVASEDVVNRLKALEQGQQEFKQEAAKRLDTVQEDTNVLKIEMQGARADISNIKATQSDHSAFFIAHGQRLKAIEEKQDTHTEILGQIVNISEEMKTTMATKDDLKVMEARLIEAMRTMLKGE